MNPALGGEPNGSSNVDVPSEEAELERGLHATYFYEGQQDLTDAQIANTFQSILYDADRYRDRFMPEITKAYLQYHGDQSDRGKDEWQ